MILVMNDAHIKCHDAQITHYDAQILHNDAEITFDAQIERMASQFLTLVFVA